MKKKITFWLIVAVLFAVWIFVAVLSASRYYKEFSGEKLIEINKTLNDEYISSNFKIQINYKIDDNYKKVTGSAFIYKKEDNEYYLLTNKHVVELPENISEVKSLVIDYRDNGYNYELVKQDLEEDLAIIKIKSSLDYKILEFDNSKLSKKDKALNISSALGYHNRIEYGYFEGLYNDKNAYSIQCNQGSSGSAILNSNYKITGILTEILHTDNVDYSLAIPTSKILNFIA